MIKWFELRNTPPFILNKKHPPWGLRGIFRLWPGGTHSAKERYGASDARFLQYVHPQNLGLSEDFAYLSAALELANTFGTSVVPKKRWSHRMGMGLLRQQRDFCRFEFGGFSWSSHYNSAGMMMVLPILPKTTLFIFLSPPDCNLMENLNFQYKCYPRHLEHRNWGRRLILPETMNCRNCPAYEVLKGGVFFFPKAAWLANNHLPGIWAEWDLSNSTRVHARLLCLHVSCRDSFFWGDDDVVMWQAWKVTLKLPATGLIPSLLWHSLADM